MIQIKPNSLRDIDLINDEHYVALEVKVLKRLKNLKKRQRDFILIHLKSILKGTPSELFSIWKKYKKWCTKKGRGSVQNFNAGLNSVFDYDAFIVKSLIKYCAYDLARKLNVKTCPYCNRNYTVTVENTKEQIVRPDFDHFFPKSQYPLLALSFYNLIPSCLICNRSIKGQQKIVYSKYLHPYEEEFGNTLKINYKPLDSDSALGIKDNYEILIQLDKGDVKKSKRCEKNFFLFKLKELYQESHNGEIADIIFRHHVTNGRYLKELHNMFPRLGTIEELYKIAFNNYYRENDHWRRPLSKLTKDIVEQLVFANPFSPVLKTP